MSDCEDSTMAMQQKRADTILRLMFTGVQFTGVASGIIFMGMGATFWEASPLFVGVILTTIAEELVADD